MTIYEIDEAILGCIDMETGEVIDLDRLNELEMKREQKISNVACWYKDLIAEADAIKAEEQNLNRRRKVCENKAESLKNWLAYVLNGNKFEDSRNKISYRRSESVAFAEGFDIESLPEQFKKITVEPKKTEIKNFLKTGATIDGCSVQEKLSIQIK